MKYFNLLIGKIRNIFIWCNWWIKVSGFASWINLSKYFILLTFTIIGLWGFASVLHTRSASPLIMVFYYFFCILFSIFLLFFFRAALIKLKDRKNRLDDLWRKVSEELGLQLTVSRSSRKLSGIYRGIEIEVTDQYTTSNLLDLGRTWAIAGRMAGVRVKSLESIQPQPNELSFNFSILEKNQWTESIKNFREPLQQILREILFGPGCYRSLNSIKFNCSQGTTCFAHEAYSSKSFDDKYDSLSLPIKQVIETHLMINHQV